MPFVNAFLSGSNLGSAVVTFNGFSTGSGGTFYADSNPSIVSDPNDLLEPLDLLNHTGIRFNNVGDYVIYVIENTLTGSATTDGRLVIATIRVDNDNITSIQETSSLLLDDGVNQGIGQYVDGDRRVDINNAVGGTSDQALFLQLSGANVTASGSCKVQITRIQ